MKRFCLLLTIPAFVLSINSFAQKRLTKDIDTMKANLCGDVFHYSPSDRLKNYPFDRVVEIRIASFDTYAQPGDFRFSLPKTNGKVNLSMLREQVVLSKNGIDSLTHILYNVGYQGTITTNETTGCFNPRNAIVFLDSAGEVFEYIEICFECMHIEPSSENIAMGEPCYGKYDLIRNFMVKRGIKFGTSLQEKK